VKRYLLGLLRRVERKNAWQLAEAVGERDPQGVQRLLNSAKWDADAVRDDLREYVMEHLGDEVSGVLIADEIGFLKKGEKSVGVARQNTGTAGDTVECQVGVFVAYASEKGVAFIDRALYLPEEWANDPKRRAEGGVPEEVAFANKLELAKRMLERAFEAGVPAKWVLADSFYGRSHEFRAWLEERGRAYAVTCPTEYKRLRAVFPRSALRGVYARIRSNESLAMGHGIPRSLLSQRPARYLIASGGAGWCRGTRMPF